MYVSFLGLSGALHLVVFEQPVQQEFFSNLLLCLSCAEGTDYIEKRTGGR